MKCSVENCQGKVRARKMCGKHYVLWSRRGTHKTIREEKGTCKLCPRMASENALCERHLKMFDRYKTLVPDYRSIANKGENNFNWNGGTSQYKNHAAFKRARITVLSSAKNTCAKCGGRAAEVHHLDGSKHNHAIGNLEAICHKCHMALHPKKTSKYKRLYGFTLGELSRKLNLPVPYICLLHKQGTLGKNL